jgi:Flp pilus assembly protein TadB
MKAMIIRISTDGLKNGKWYEYLIRFVLGGLVTAAAAMLAKKYGPGFGGLFLAFPALLSASVTLIEKHERERKAQKGLHGTNRSRQAAGADAAGAAMGSVGLMVFAVIVWQLLRDHSARLVLGCATVIWASVAAGVWWAWKRHYLRRLRRAVAGLSRTGDRRPEFSNHRR